MTITPNKALTQPVVGGDNNTWGGELNTDLALIDNALGGTLGLSISGNTTLNSTQVQNSGYHFTGNLSGAATITWPSSFFGTATIRNSTTGGFSIVCGISGGATVTVLNGETIAVWSDGTDFVRLAATGGGVTVPNSGLTNSSVTISGHSLSLGGSLSLAAGDVSGLAAVATSGSASDLTTGTLPNPRLSAVPNSALANSSIAIAGHSVSLGGSQTLAAADLTNGTTGSGSVVLATSPSLTTPNIGAASASSLTTTLAWPGSFGSSPTNVINLNVGNFPAGGFVPAGIEQGITSTMSVPNSYTQQPWPNANFFAEIINNNGGVSGNSAVGYLSMGIIANTNGYAASTNGVITNTATTPWQPTNGSGSNIGLAVGAEYDFNIMKVGSSTPAGSINGIALLGGSEVAPAGGAYGVHVYPLGSGVPWTIGFRTEDAATIIGLDLGALSTGNNVASQPIFLRSRTSGGVNNAATIQADANSNVVVAGNSVVGQTFNATTAGHILQLNGTDLISNGGGFNIFADTTAHGALWLGSGLTLYRQGTHTFQNTSGGTTYATIDGSGLTLVVPTALVNTSVNMANGAGAGAGTLTNAPTAGNPTKWIPINDNGTTRYIPTW